MVLFLEAEKDKFGIGETITVSLLALNNSYEPVALDRRLLVGPNPIPECLVGAPFPVSVEPAFHQEEQNLIMLNPWCFYGRRRTFDSFPPGRVTFYSYLLRHASELLLPEKPGESEALFVSAEPLEVTVGEGF
ncbi:MAG TPA: hypothetical protein VHY08_09220 [Bacillota bacterium]|nr:hypothetical protein [Bacillota bacterium]